MASMYEYHSERESGEREQPYFESYVNPHTNQGGSMPEYFIGDVYERMDAGLKRRKLGYQDHTAVESPYLRYIKDLSTRGWPQLEYLADFIECSTVPIKNKVLIPEDRLERKNRLRVAVLDVPRDDCIVWKEFTAAAELSSHLYSPTWTDETGDLRLVVVEDLSAAVIELLGARYDIDPSFFRGHMCDYVWYNLRDPWFETPVLDSRQKAQTFINFRHFAARYYPDAAAIEAAKRQIGGFNVLRRIEFDSAETNSDVPGADVGLTRTSTSFWVRPIRSKTSKQGWLGVLLLDPTISAGFPLWGGHANSKAPPSMSQVDEIARTPPTSSSSQEVLRWVMSLDPAELKIMAKDPEYILASVYDVMASQWLVVLEYMTTRLSHIEWELESERWRTPRGLDGTLKKLHPWRRRILFYRNHIQSAINLLGHRYADSSPSIGGGYSGTPHWVSRLNNFHQLLRRLENVHQRANKIDTVLTSIISIEESKKAMENARDVTRITYLAFIYVPLSFVATFLSMNAEFPNGDTTVYWVYFVIAIPLTSLAFICAIYWKSWQEISHPGKEPVTNSWESNMRSMKKRPKMK